MKGEIIKDVSEYFRGRAVLYKAPKPVKIDGKEMQYFVVSAVNDVVFGVRLNETLMFPADKKGNVLSWLDVFGISYASVEDCIEEFENQYFGDERNEGTD